MTTKTVIPVGTEWKLEETDGACRVGKIKLMMRYPSGDEHWHASWCYLDGSTPFEAMHQGFGSYRSARDSFPFKGRAFCVFKP